MLNFAYPEEVVTKFFNFSKNKFFGYMGMGESKALYYADKWRILRQDVFHFIRGKKHTLAVNGRQKVLLIANSPLSEVIQRSLQACDADLEVVTIANGHDALFRSENFLPDVVILDVDIPGMNGQEILRTLGRSARNGKIRVLVIGGREENAGHFVVRDDSMITLSKPLVDKELRKSVDWLLAMGRATCSIGV